MPTHERNSDNSPADQILLDMTKMKINGKIIHSCLSQLNHIANTFNNLGLEFCFILPALVPHPAEEGELQLGSIIIHSDPPNQTLKIIVSKANELITGITNAPD